MTKFVVSTALTIASYAGLTKYRHYKTRKDAEKEILAEMAAEKNNKDKFLYTAPTSTAFNNVKQKKQTTFTGSIQDFMYNPVKNLMILDGAITAERLAESRNKQELLGYTIKEGSVWLFMYFASKPIQKFLEQAAEKNKKNPASIDLDARVIESEELKKAFENGKLTESSKKVLSLNTHEELLDFIHNNPDDFVVQMAKKSDVLPILKDAKQADNIDYRKFIDYDEFKGVAEKLTKLQNKFEEFKNADVKEKTLEAFLDNVKKLKRRSILKNMGACIGALGILAPALMIAFRKLDKNNNAFQVKEDLKKELAAKGKILGTRLDSMVLGLISFKSTPPAVTTSLSGDVPITVTSKFCNLFKTLSRVLPSIEWHFSSGLTANLLRQNSANDFGTCSPSKFLILLCGFAFNSD